MANNGTPGRGTSSTTPRASAKVYRRRRIVALVLVLLVVGGLVWGGFAVAGLVGSMFDGGPEQGGPVATEASTAPATGQAKDPAKGGTPPAAVCDEAGIKVSAAVDKPAYGPDEKPVLTLKVSNTGKAPCDINVGTSQMEYQITSGNDIIFNSKFCQAEATDLVKNLAPGASETANLEWQLNRTVPGCGKVSSEPGRGGATYALVATLGKWSSDKVTFTLQ